MQSYTLDIKKLATNHSTRTKLQPQTNNNRCFSERLMENVAVSINDYLKRKRDKYQHFSMGMKMTTINCWKHVYDGYRR